MHLRPHAYQTYALLTELRSRTWQGRRESNSHRRVESPASYPLGLLPRGTGCQTRTDSDRFTAGPRCRYANPESLGFKKNGDCTERHLKAQRSSPDPQEARSGLSPFFLASVGGFEPAAGRVEAACSSPLSYTPETVVGRAGIEPAVLVEPRGYSPLPRHAVRPTSNWYLAQESNLEDPVSKTGMYANSISEAKTEP